MMGDFNMSFFKVIDQLRSRGLEIDLAAWYPWKAASGTTMADSCGIFFIGYKATFKLCYGLECLHGNDFTGLGCNQVDPRTEKTFSVHEKNGGPGQTLATYMPKDWTYEEKLKTTLTGTHCPEKLVLLPPMDRLKHAVAGTEQSFPNGGWNFLRFKEKKLEDELWALDGKSQGGSHFPLCVFTHNASRRSPERYEVRQNRRPKAHARQWASRQPRHEAASVAIASAGPQESAESARSGYWSASQTSNRSGGWAQQGWSYTEDYTQDA
jgi:hypothetical protein